MRTLVLLMAALLIAAGLASVPAQAIGTKKEIKVGFIYISPIGDEGWSYSHDQARKFLSTLPDVTTSYVESVPEGHDAERIIQNMARKQYDVIFATSFGYMDSMLNVAEDFPNSTFMHCSGYKTAPNMSNYFGRIYQARYLTGLVAGSMTKSNVIGYVAAFPLPEVIRGINAFTLGVRAVNPKAEVHVVWTKSWYAPAVEKNAAKDLIREGADVIAQHQDSSGPQEAAQEQGVYSVGYNTDMSRVAPKAHMTSAIWSWNSIYQNVVEQVRAGTWENGSFWYGMETGVVDIAPYGPMVPQGVRELTDKAKADIKSGELVVFAGPVKDQKGVEHILSGTVPSDKELLGMDWFVEGVIGTPE